MRTIDILLQWLTPILILTGAALSIKGQTWNKHKNRPTRVGWCMLLVALCTMAASISSSLLSTKLKDIAATEEKQRYETLRKAQTDANQTAQQTLAVGVRSYLTQFVVNQIEVKFSGYPDDYTERLHGIVGNRLKRNIKPSDSVSLMTEDGPPGVVWIGPTLVASLDGKELHDFANIVGNLAFSIALTIDSLSRDDQDLIIGRGLEVESFNQEISEMSIVYRPQRKITAAALRNTPVHLTLYYREKPPANLRVVARGPSFQADTRWFKPTWKHIRDTFEADTSVMDAKVFSGPDAPGNASGPSVITPAGK